MRIGLKNFVGCYSRATNPKATRDDGVTLQKSLNGEQRSETAFGRPPPSNQQGHCPRAATGWVLQTMPLTDSNYVTPPKQAFLKLLLNAAMTLDSVKTCPAVLTFALVWVSRSALSAPGARRRAILLSTVRKAALDQRQNDYEVVTR